MILDPLAAGEGDPARPALVTRDRVLTYAELEASVQSGAEDLLAAGIHPGAVVAFDAKPGAAAIVRLLALWRLGAVVSPIHHRATEAERQRVHATVAALGHSEDPLLPDETQAVLWTSGTTERARGMVLSARTFEANAAASAERLGLAADDVWVASLSMAHVGGLALVARAFLLGSAVYAIESGEEGVADVLTAPTEDRAGALAPTHVSLVPTQLQRLLQTLPEGRPPPSLRCALVGGAHAPAKLIQRALAIEWPLALTYGTTEMGSQIATAPPELVRAKPGTVGTAMPRTEVRIEDDGEIHARGAMQALGVVSVDPGSSVAHVEPLADREGWYRTGDFGRIDDEGHLWITGRRADRIVTGGTTVDAREIEDVLRGHPDVVDACVVGVPSDEWGERVGAWVEHVPDGCELIELEEFLRAKVRAPKRPRVWHLGGSVPTNKNGKPDRDAVRVVLERTLA